MEQPTAMDQRVAMAASRCRACGGNGCAFCFGKVKDEVLAEQRARIAELEAELQGWQQNAAFYKCCALSGEVPKPGTEPYCPRNNQGERNG